MTIKRSFCYATGCSSSHFILSPTMSASDHTVPVVIEEVGGTRKRFWVLFVFCLLSLTNAFQWIQYSIITEIIKKFYRVSDLEVNATSIVFMLVYVPLIFPATWCLTKKGLRYSLLLGALGNLIGALIKCFSLQPDRFWLAMVGQTVAAVAQIFVLNIPPILAAIWFPHEEVSRATAVGVFGNQIGVALGFIMPTYIVFNGTDAEISYRLGYIMVGSATLCAVTFLLMLFTLDDKPSRPPSYAQTYISGQTSYTESLKTLFTNKNFDLLLICYGMNSGILFAISTLLEQIVHAEFPGHETSAGDLGLIATVSGLFGAALGGIILDKTHWYKGVTIVSYALCCFSVALLAGLLLIKVLWTIYLGSFLLGFFMAGYLPIGFEYAAEITFPEKEGTSAGLLNASSQVFSIILILTGSVMIDSLGSFWTMFTYSAILAVGFLLTLVTKADLRRLNAETEGINAQSSYQVYN